MVPDLHIHNLAHKNVLFYKQVHHMHTRAHCTCVHTHTKCESVHLLPASCTCLCFRYWPCFTDIQWDHLPKSSSTETFFRSETPSSTYPGKNIFRKPSHASCFKVPSLLPGEAWHPFSVATRGLFTGRMLRASDPGVNPAVIRDLTRVWRGELFVFTACLVGMRWLEADFPFARFPPHERESKCYDVTLCVWFLLSARLAHLRSAGHVRTDSVWVTRVQHFSLLWGHIF